MDQAENIALRTRFCTESAAEKRIWVKNYWVEFESNPVGNLQEFESNTVVNLKLLRNFTLILLTYCTLAYVNCLKKFCKHTAIMLTEKKCKKLRKYVCLAIESLKKTFAKTL